MTRVTEWGAVADPSKFPLLDPNELDATGRAIGAAIRVHRTLGPGLLEGLYHRALAIELGRSGIKYDVERPVVLTYAGVEIGTQRLDLVIEDRIVVELKAVEALSRLHRAQLLSYLRATRIRIGLLMNFNSEVLTVKRILNG